LPPIVSYHLTRTDTETAARLGHLETPHGRLETPAFMPVGTQATVKGLLPRDLREAGSRMLLANTYHLALRPGEDVVQALGGVHTMMAWDGPILTDSGGFQAFSLAAKRKLTEDGVQFRSHLDGRLLNLTPEHAIAIQEALGADVAMCLDQCPALPAPRSEIEAAVDRTIRWARRCREARTRSDQAVFGIVQGGPHADLRARCADELIALDFEGYAVGGVSVGEGPDEIRRAVEVSAPRLPPDKVRYLMGVGRPEDILDAVAAGIDIFDCVLPTRNGRNATCLTANGPLKLRNAVHKRALGPIEPGCDCLACRQYSRGTIRHLFLAGEMLGPILASLHNLAYLHRLTREIRHAIAEDRFAAYRADALARLAGGSDGATDSGA
jgi:queuine tRNA-ribosyltransferase